MRTKFTIQEIWNMIMARNFWPIDCVTEEGYTRPVTFNDFYTALVAYGHNLLDFCMKYKSLDQCYDAWAMCEEFTGVAFNGEYSWNAEVILTVQYKLNEMEVVK